MKEDHVRLLRHIYLLLARLWVGSSMIRGGQSILRFFKSQELRDFFQDWFGNELGFPAPLLMAFLAKGTEFVGGIFICLGFLTRISAAFIAFVMLVATLVANLDYSSTGNLIRSDGIVTISNFLFACLLLLFGPGKFSVDAMFLKNRSF